MANVLFSAPSVGSVTKKIVEINPDLTVQQIIGVIRQSTLRQTQPEEAGEFASIDVIDEPRALELARATLKVEFPA